MLSAHHAVFAEQGIAGLPPYVADRRFAADASQREVSDGREVPSVGKATGGERRTAIGGFA
ncbi:MAG: hypothetical protein D6753_07390 [Planctomycetota bacterium]|nr:MAG: hypothetical protein D6753_07390 [Planctomycetota bacterium]